MCNLCKLDTNQKKLVLSESGTKTSLTINNSQSLDMYHILVDGCFIKTGKRCDHAVKLKGSEGINERQIFVELKGCDVTKAAEQILSTVNSGRFDLNSKDISIAAIVSTKNPLNSTQTAKIQKEFLIKHNIKLKFFKMKATEEIKRLAS